MASTPKHRMSSSIRERLVQDLADALASERQIGGDGGSVGGDGGPGIIANRLARLGKIDLIVIWDRWGKIPFEERTEIILESWKRARPSRQDEVYTASGRTRQEAIVLGYLPYRVQPAEFAEIDEDLRRRIKVAMKSKFAIISAEDCQARFGSFDQAKRAFIHLREAIPDVDWLIVEEVVKEI